MFRNKPLWMLTAVFCLMLVFTGEGFANPQLISGTPLIPPVAAGGPVPIRPASTSVGFSLLGDQATQLPLQEKFYVTLFNSSGMRQVTADLHYPISGDPSGHLNIYVETGVPVDRSLITSLAREFEHTIHPIINEHFGVESDIDHNNQVTLLITALDAGNISGYFDSRNQYSNQWIANSNEREMIYINSQVLRYGSNTVLQTLAHEFTHLVHWNYKWNYSPDNIWFAEGMAMYSGYLIGKVTGQTHYWDFNSIRAFLRSYSSVSVIDWQQRYEDYGAAYAYMIYLSEHYSPGHLRRLFQDPRSNRLEALAEHLAGYDTSLAEVLVDWAVANAFDLPSNPYGYSDLSVGLNTSSFPKLPGSSFGLPSWVGRYWRLETGTSKDNGLSIRVSGDSGLAARLVEKLADGQVVVHKFQQAGGELQCERAPYTLDADVIESTLVVTSTGNQQGVSVTLGAYTPSPADMEVRVIPDLLLPGRYTVLIKAKPGLDSSPTVQVSGRRSDQQLSITQAWTGKGVYLTEPFVSQLIGSGPVLLEVKGHQAGRAIEVRKTLQLE